MTRRLSRLLCDPLAQVLLLFLVALVARLLFLVLTGFYGRVLNNDAYEYDQIAVSLLAGHGFAFGPGQPTAFRPYGYPFFLAAVYGALGRVTAWVQWVQVVLGSLLVVPTYALSRRLAGPLVAVLAGLGVALHPVLLYQTALVAPEIVAILLQMLLLWSVLRLVQSSTFGWADLLGFIVVGALAALMRPELLAVTWLLGVGFAIHLGLGSRRARTLLLATVLATILAVAPPVIRNWATFDAFIPFPTVGGVTFWGANNASSSGGWVLPSAATWPDEQVPANMRGWPDLSEQQSQNRFYRASWHWIEQNPGAALALVPRKLVRSWTLSYADEGRSSALPPAANVLNWAFGLLVLIGMVLALCRFKSVSWVLFAPVVAWLAKTIIFYGSARQTAPVLPVICIFAALALLELFRFVHRKLPNRPAP